MVDSVSSIKEMFLKMKEMEEELNALKKQQSIQKDTTLGDVLSTKKSQKSEKQEQNCPICCDKQQVPVFLNGYEKDLTFGNFRTSKLVPCPASQANMSCLRCTRQQIEYHEKKGDKYFMCPTKCHKIPLKVFKRWELYGEMGRDPNGPPCPAMYRMMDANGIGCRTCTACDKVCEGVFALAMHQKNECSVRKVQCEVCKEHMSVDELEEHKKTCYRFCKHCGPDGPRIEYNKIKGKMSFTSHECPKKTLAKCRTCQGSITFNNINEHKKCSLAFKSDHKTTFALKKEEEAVRQAEAARQVETARRAEEVARIESVNNSSSYLLGRARIVRRYRD